jgi:glutaredoxin
VLVHPTNQMKRKEDFQASPQGSKPRILNAKTFSSLDSTIIILISQYLKNPKPLHFINKHWNTILVQNEVIDLTNDDIEVNDSFEKELNNSIQFPYFTIDFINEFEWNWFLKCDFENYSFKTTVLNPVFSIENFLSLLSFIEKNSTILQKSKFRNMKELFLKLNPHHSCCFENVDEVRNFIEISYSIMKKDLDFDDISLSIEEFKISKENQHYEQENIALIEFCVNSLNQLMVEHDKGMYVGDLVNKIPFGKGAWISEDFTENYFGNLDFIHLFRVRIHLLMKFQVLDEWEKKWIWNSQQ